MGGKSRKTGGVSEKLIQRLKAMSEQDNYIVKVNSGKTIKKS